MPRQVRRTIPKETWDAAQRQGQQWTHAIHQLDERQRGQAKRIMGLTAATAVLFIIDIVGWLT